MHLNLLEYDHILISAIYACYTNLWVGLREFKLSHGLHCILNGDPPLKGKCGLELDSFPVQKT